LGEWRYSFTHSLTSALVGGEWSASRPGRFTPWHPLDRRLGGPQSRSERGSDYIYIYIYKFNGEAKRYIIKIHP
jgi:hypothetical protein